MKVSVLLVGHLLLLFSTLGFAQESEEQRIINTLPSNLPIKVEIVNGGMKSALDNIEIRITNTGKKPILVLDLSLSSAEPFTPDNFVGLDSFHFGKGALADFSDSFETFARIRESAPTWPPGEIKIFSVNKKIVPWFWKLMIEKGYSHDAKIALHHIVTVFDDGTGFDTPQAVPMKH